MPRRPRTPMYDLIDRLIKALSVVYTVLFMAVFFSVPLRTRFGIQLFEGQRYYAAYMACLFLMVMALFALHAIRNHMKGSIFPEEPPDTIRFMERSASGRSFGSFFSRVGGANNCLEVTVTEDELWTRLGWPFRVLSTGAEFGLENRIPLASITTVTRTGWQKRRFLVEYRDENGTANRLELALRHPDDFTSALCAGNPGIQLSDG